MLVTLFTIRSPIEVLACRGTADPVPTFRFALGERINPGVEPGLIREWAHTGVMSEVSASTDAVSTSTARPDDTTSDIVVYARPGCPFCTMLRADLASAGIGYRERDIWQDPEAAAAVRAAANGNETVPTVNVGDVWLVNPSVDEVRAVLRKAA
jgi:mycoredoxin